MDLTSILKWAGILLIGREVLTRAGGAASERIVVGNPDISFLGFSGSGAIELSISFPIENKLPTSLSVNSMAGELYYGNYRLASFVRGAPFTLEAGQTVKTEFSVSADISQLAGNVVELIGRGDFFQHLRIKGVIQAGGVNIPYNTRVTLVS